MKTFCTGIVFLLFMPALSQTHLDSSRHMADSIYGMIKQRSVYRENVSWDSIDLQFGKRLDTASTADQQFRAFSWLFRKLNDFHSFVIYKNRSYQYFKPAPQGREADVKYIYEQINLNAGNIKISVLENKYAYILLPAVQMYDSASIQRQSKSWRDSVCKYVKAHKKIKGWVIDLRLNMGGNMYPMLEAISFLLGDVRFAGTADANGKIISWWSLSGGDIYTNSTYRNTYAGKHCLPITSKMPVALLTSLLTVSSGEIVTTAFKQRVKTVQVGDTTGGLVTTNQYIPVNKDAALNISVGYYADRTGRIYKTGIVPDIAVTGGDDFADVSRDKKIQAALKWLRKKIRATKRSVSAGHSCEKHGITSSLK
jgi:carboxyl-terminal processing protease